MATHRIPIVPATPDSSGRAYWETYTVTATNDFWPHAVLRLVTPTQGQQHGAAGTFLVPKNYVGTPKFVLNWSVASASTNNFACCCPYRAVAAGENLDQATAQETITATTAGPGTTDQRVETLFALTAGNFAVDDVVEFKVQRYLTGGSDTLAADVVIHHLAFEYTDA